jgi:hypothetical protein
MTPMSLYLILAPSRTLTLHRVSHNQQNSINPWIGWVLSQPKLTLDMVNHNQQNFTNLISFSGVLLVQLTISRVRLG